MKQQQSNLNKKLYHTIMSMILIAPTTLFANAINAQELNNKQPLETFAKDINALEENNKQQIETKANKENQLQDMSDPLAVYTQAGFGVTDKGLNLKFGQTYDTGNDATMAMNIIELKGIAGEAIGWSGNSSRDNSIDSFRLRNFQINLESGIGSQFDANYNVENESMDLSYSLMQALPKMGGLNIYPLAGLGLNITNGEFAASDDDVNTSGYTLAGTFGLVGAYSKYAITDKMWLNYNPMWLSTISGADSYVENAYGTGNSSIFLNEFIISYQFTPRFNARYFANWSQYQDFTDGDHRIEFNYQF